MPGYVAHNGLIPSQTVGAIVLEDLSADMLVLVINNGPDLTITTLGALRSFIGGTGVSVDLTATGTTQGTAVPLPGGTNVFTTVPASSGTIIPNTALVGDIWDIWNAGAHELALYPLDGAQFEDFGANVPVIVASGGRVQVVYNSTGQFYAR